jgi:phosphotriesterase-related protein
MAETRMKSSEDRSFMTRRQAVGLLGAALGGGLVARAGIVPSLAHAAVPRDAGSAASRRQAAVIRTLRGDLAPDEIGPGALLFHEHLNMHYPLGSETSFTDDVDLMINEVKIAASEGVALIVDGGHADMDRDLDALRRIDRESGMPIVASGGYYMQRSYPDFIATQSAEEIAAGLAEEAAQQGFGAIGEIGQQGGELTPDETKVFQAVGMAQVRTRLPVFTHNAYSIRATDVPRDAAIRQLDILQSAGADPGKLAIGHVCCLDDPSAEVASEIASRGAYVGFDRVTLNATMPDENRVTMAVAMIDAGHADRLLLSSDFYSARSLKRDGGNGLAQTLTVFVPMLRDAGVPEETLQMILVDNPKRFLAFVPKA